MALMRKQMLKMGSNFSRLEKSNIPLPITIWLAFPIILSAFFYIPYANSAWFFQDDFCFIADYTNSIKLNQLFDFTSFGRFVSRNVYWHLGVKIFSYDARCFFILNFFLISATSFLLYKLFEKHGRVEGAVAGLFYFMLPATIESYAWISNSQHLAGHFFVVLFTYLLIRDDTGFSCAKKLLRTVQLVAVLTLGFSSNIFMGMVLSLPIWKILTEENYRRSKSAYAVLFIGIALFALFFYKLSGNQAEAYATSYTYGILSKNLEYYFKRRILAVFWLVSIVCGASYAFIRKKHFVSWLFLASAAFFAPFAFLVHQRYVQYGALAYLFFLLAIWSLLVNFGKDRWPNLVKYAGLIMVIFLFLKSLESPIKRYSKNPRGAAQKQQVDFLRVFDAQHPDVIRYCFRPDKTNKNTTGVKEWDIPGDWWSVGFGTAFSLFVNHEKTYELARDSAYCDVVFVFKDGVLIAAQ